MKKTSLLAAGRYLLARLSEASTYAAFAAVLGTAGYVIDPGTMKAVMQVGMGASALAAVAMKG